MRHRYVFCLNNISFHNKVNAFDTLDRDTLPRLYDISVITAQTPRNSVYNGFPGRSKIVHLFGNDNSFSNNTVKIGCRVALF